MLRLNDAALVKTAACAYWYVFIAFICPPIVKKPSSKSKLFSIHLLSDLLRHSKIQYTRY